LRIKKDVHQIVKRCAVRDRAGPTADAHGRAPWRAQVAAALTPMHMSMALDAARRW
jgi:hypothetical protein